MDGCRASACAQLARVGLGWCVREIQSGEAGSRALRLGRSIKPSPPNALFMTQGRWPLMVGRLVILYLDPFESPVARHILPVEIALGLNGVRPRGILLAT